MRPLVVWFVIGIAAPFSPQAFAEGDNLYLRCTTTAMRLCQGDTTLQGCPTPWLSAEGGNSTNSAFLVSRVEDKWTLKKDFTAELTMVNPSSDFFEFTFTSDNDWARLRIDRLTGDLFELYGLPGDEILAAKGSCEKVEMKF